VLGAKFSESNLSSECVGEASLDLSSGGAICSSRLQGPSSDYPGRAFTAVRTIPTPKLLRGNLLRKGEYGGSRFSLDQGPHANVIGPADASP